MTRASSRLKFSSFWLRSSVASLSGDTKGASLYLDKAGETPEKTLLQGIMQMLNGNYTEAENLLHKAEEAGLPQAGENLKILHEIY